MPNKLHEQANLPCTMQTFSAHYAWELLIAKILLIASSLLYEYIHMSVQQPHATNTTKSMPLCMLQT